MFPNSRFMYPILISTIVNVKLRKKAILCVKIKILNLKNSLTKKKKNLKNSKSNLKLIRSGQTRKHERLKPYQEALEAQVRLSFALLISLPCEPTFSIYPVLGYTYNNIKDIYFIY